MHPVLGLPLSSASSLPAAREKEQVGKVGHGWPRGQMLPIDESSPYDTTRRLVSPKKIQVRSQHLPNLG